MVDRDQSRYRRIPENTRVFVGDQEDPMLSAYFNHILAAAGAHDAQKFEVASDNPAARLSGRERMRRVDMFMQDPIGRQIRESMASLGIKGLKTQELEVLNNQLLDRMDEYMATSDPKKALERCNKGKQKRT